MKFIVTAGGQGTKLWPLSRENKPKQFQEILPEKTLFSYTVETLLKAFNPSDIYISTKKGYVGLCLKQAPKISVENYIIEPDIAKNRGPAEGFAFLKMLLKHPDEPFFIVQPDDLRHPEEKFIEMIHECEKLVKRDKKFISGGIKATYPTLGVDYLKLGDRVKNSSNLDVYKVEEFIERPNDYHKTKLLIENFHITTHCNHNCWYPELMLNAYKKYRPDWYESLMEIKKALDSSNAEEKINEIYSKMESGPTEEVTKNLFKEGYIVLLPFRWVDIGAWNSVYEYFSENGNNYVDGNAVVLDTKGSVIKSTNKNKIVAVKGLTDVVIVDTEDALLVIDKKQAGEISEILKKLKEKNLSSYL